MNAEDEDLLVPIFMTLDPILEACLEWVSKWFATGYAVNVVCPRLCGCTKADANCCINRYSLMLKA